MFTVSKESGFLFIAVLLLQIVLTLSLFGSHSELNFAGEYGCLAESLVTGKGYGNVFCTSSGPSAWSSPFLVWIIAGAFYLFGIKSLMSVWLLLLIQFAAIAATACMLKEIAKLAGFFNQRFLIVLIFLFLILIQRSVFLNSINDVHFLIFLSALLLYNLLLLIKLPSHQKLFYMLFTALAISLSSANLSLIFVLIIASFVLYKASKIVSRNRNKTSNWISRLFYIISCFYKHNSLKIACLASIIFIFSTALWGYRNYKVFGQFIPLKSNLWYEFYQANKLDDDGVLSVSTMLINHPSANGEERYKYETLGETQYLDAYKQKSLIIIKNNFDEYFTKILNRMAFAFLYATKITDDFDYREPTLHLTQDEANKLTQAKMMNGNKWMLLTCSEKEFREKLSKLHLPDENKLINDWMASKQFFLAKTNSLVGRIQSLFISGIPFVCLLVGIFIKQIRASSVFKLTVFSYFIYLLPYIVISHYQRYQLGLIAFQAILIFFPIAYSFTKISKTIHPLSFNIIKFTSPKL